jgi:hypothetical protein
LPRVRVAGRTFALLGRLARGEGSDVFLARRDARLTELVVLKVLRVLADADLLAGEWRALAALHESTAQGAHFFTTLLPQPVAHGELVPASEPSAAPRPTSVFRWRSGFLHTLDDVVREYPAGVEPQTAVWMWKRVLEVLGWVHRSRYVHGAVLPVHWLVHPRDHGVVLVGWSRAVPYAGRATAPLPATSAASEAYYPRAVWSGAPSSPATDITMSARCVVRALGGDPARGTLPARVPAPIADVLRAHADDAPSAARTDDAWELMQRVGQAGRAAYGPARYHPFRMPGWR